MILEVLNKGLMKFKFSKKNAQVMKFFWSAFFIFIVSVESFLVLMLYSKMNHSANEDVSLNYNIVNDVGPILPVYIDYDSDLKNALINYDVSDYYKKKAIAIFSKYFDPDLASVEISIVDKAGDNYYSFDSDYTEVFYLKISDKYLKFNFFAKKEFFENVDN